MITKLIGAIVCHFRGHRRGKRVEAIDNGATKRFKCPRCGRINEYKLAKVA